MWPLRSGSCQHRNSHAVHFAPCTSVCQCRECKFQCSVVPGGQLFFAQGAADREPADSMSGALFFFKPGFESVCFWIFFEFLSKLCKGSELLQKVVNTSQFWCRISHVFWGVGRGQLFKHVSRTGIQIELRFVTTVLFFPVFWTWNFRRHVFWTPRIGYAYNWNDPCVRFRQEATVDIHTHITSADTHTHITSADIHAHMLGHADAHLVIAGHHTCITKCACTCACPPHIWSSLATILVVAHCRHTCAHYICIHSCTHVLWTSGPPGPRGYALSFFSLAHEVTCCGRLAGHPGALLAIAGHHTCMTACACTCACSCACNAHVHVHVHVHVHEHMHVHVRVYGHVHMHVHGHVHVHVRVHMHVYGHVYRRGVV